jgi:pimeloyl-ACP methyl ester carboxylesterase
MLQTSADGIAGALRGMAERPDVTAELPQLSLPTLVVCGEHDAISPPDEMRAMAAAIRGSRFVLVPRAGHMAPLEQPSTVNEAIEAFLGSIV